MPRQNESRKILIAGTRAKRMVVLLASSLLLFVVPPSSQACTISMSTVYVSSSFRVIVRHGSTPIAGIKVEVYDNEELERSKTVSEWKPILQLVTARDGVAEVKNLRSGTYIVETKGPGGGDAVYAKVGGKREVSKQVSLQWPFSLRGTLRTKSLSGELVSNDLWSPFQNVQVQLWAAGLDAPLAVDDTGPEGRFRFDESRPGIYVLRIQGRQKVVPPDWQVRGDMAVELVPSAPDAFTSLALRLEMSTCGIEYSSCAAAHTTIAMRSRHIKVINGPGVSEYPGIKDAKYKLLDDHQRSIAEGTTDDGGNAELPSEPLGKATLVVSSPLMTTVEQSLTLLPQVEGAPDLVVTMKVIVGLESECSTVSLEAHATSQ